MTHENPSLREEFYAKGFKAEPYVMQEIADWWINKFLSQLDMVEEEIKKMDTVNKISPSGVSASFSTEFMTKIITNLKAKLNK